MSVKQWVPLESNPEILTSFGHALGLPPSLTFSDVWSLDLLPMVPTPRHAVLLLYPLTPSLTSRPPPATPPPNTPPPYFCKQTIANACGTVALLHAALNLPPGTLAPDAFLADFLSRTASLSPEQRAGKLHEEERLDAVHARFAAQGQTQAPRAEEAVELHFVCFVRVGGRLWELDGREEGARDWGECAEVLEAAGRVIADEFMKRDPGEHRFTILALTEGGQGE